MVLNLQAVFKNRYWQSFPVILFSTVCGLLISFGVLALPQEFIIVTMVIAIYLLSLCIIFSTQGGIKILTPVWLFFFFYSMVLFVGSLIQYWQDQDSDYLNLKLMLIVTGGILFFSLGVLGINILARFRSRLDLRDFLNRPWIDPLKGQLSYLALWIIILFSSSLIVVYFLLYGISMMEENVELHRNVVIREAGFLFHGFSVLFPIGLIIVCLKAQLYKHRWWRVVLIAVCAMGIMVAFLTSFRSIIFMLTLYFLLAMQWKSSPLKWKNIYAWGFILLLLFLFITGKRFYGAEGIHLFSGVLSLKDLVSGAALALMDRILMDNPISLANIINSIPQWIEYFYGRHILMDIKAIAPGPDLSFAGFLNSLLYQDPDMIGTTITIVGELYANFGITGVILGMFLSGVTMQALYINFIRGKKRILRVAFFVYLSVSMAWVVTHGWGGILPSWLLPGGIVFLFLKIIASFDLLYKFPGNK